MLTATVADHLTFIMETHQLLPATRFDGRPGRTATDAMHFLANTIKASWRAGKVTAALFLGIEGAFSNADTAPQEHNLRKRKVPRRTTSVVRRILSNRATMLRFDGYKSEPMVVDDGIGQDDPLFVGLYQIYNADL